jgi:hypothetical protein
MTGVLRRLLALFALMLLLVAPAAAQTFSYTLYIDGDNNATTGCTVILPTATITGVETAFSATVAASATPQVNASSVSTCSGGSFSVPTPGGSGAVSVSAGSGGATAIEITDALSALGLTGATTVRLYLVAQSASGSDLLLTTNGAVGGAPILFAIGSGPPVGPPAGGVVATPMLSIAMAVLLVAGLLLIGSRAARRRWMQRMLVGMILFSGIAGATIFNWSGINPLATDPAGDSTSGETAIDLRDLFAAISGANAYFRFDVTGNLAVPVSAPVAVADSYTTSLNTTLNVPVPGVLVNDTVNGATITAHTNPAHATLVLNANGSFAYTPATGYTGSDSFSYTISNAGGSSTATVTLNIVAGPVAIADSYTTTLGVALSVPAPGLLGNDQLGAPTASLQSFGGGDAGGTVTSNPPGSSATLAGANLVVAADGSINLAAPASTGTFAFQYRIANSQGTSDGTVTITVNPPVPIANPVSATVAVNSTANPITLNITGGTPSSVAVSTAPAHGATAVSGTSITYTPTAGYIGADSFAYTATNAGGTSAPATVSITVNPQPPVANAVSASVLANSTNNPISLNVSGGAPSSAAISALPANGTATVASPTSVLYTPNANYTGPDSFQYTVTNAAGTSAPATVTLSVNQGPAVTTNPTDQTVNAGQTATFTAAAIGSPTPTVQWQISSDGGSTFSNVAGATTTTLSLSNATSAQDGTKYRAVFSNAAGTATTIVATLTVDFAPTVTTNPTTLAVSAGSTATFTAAANGNPTPAVQWQLSTNGGATFSNIAGATSATLSFVAAPTNDGSQYRAVFSNAVGTATTTAATLTVTAGPVITTNPVDDTVDAGQTATFTAAASGNPTPTVQWQLSIDGGATFNDVPGATTATLTLANATPSQNATKYRAVFTNTTGTATTTVATLTVDFAPTVATNPTPQTVASGSTATFSAAASGNPTPSVQWQVSTDGGTTFGNIAGATSTTLSFTTTVSQDQNQYRAVFTNVVGSATTTAATLTVTSAPAITTNPTSTTVNAGQTASFSAAASGDPTPTVQWQLSTDGGATFNNIGGATATTLTLSNVTSAQNATKYRAVFTNSIGSATTTAATLTVNFAPSVTTNPGSQTVTNGGGTASFVAAANGNPTPTVQWQLSTNGGVSFSNISGATSTTLSFTAVQGNNGNQYRAVFTNSVGSATTTAATLTVLPAPPVANGSSATVAYNSSNNPITLNITGGAASSVAVSTPASNGTATASGTTITYTPANGYFGSDSFQYTATNAGGTSSPATVTITVSAPPPTAVADTYPQTVLGNVSINSAVIPYSVTSNDTLPSGTMISAFDAASAHGGSVTMTTSGAGMGQFTYNPPAGFTGTDTFTYTLSSAGGNSTGTVSLTISGMIWFINGAASVGDGRLATPFNSVAAFQAVNNGSGTHPKAGDSIFVYNGTYAGPLTLLNSQKLVGAGATASLSTITGLTPPPSSAALPATGGTAPTINYTGASATSANLTLASNNTVSGLILGTSNFGNPILGTNPGTLSISDSSVASSGTCNGGIDLINLTATFAATINNVSANTSCQANIAVHTCTTGTCAGGGSITVTNSKFEHNTSTIGAIDVDVVHQGTSMLTYTVSGNTMRQLAVAAGNQNSNFTGNSININLSGGSLMQGRIINNTIGKSGSVQTGSTGGDGIGFSATGTGTLTTLLSGNVVNEVAGNNALDVTPAFTGAATLNMTVTGNTFNVDATSLNSAYGVNVATGQTASDSSTTCLNLSGNTANGAASNGGAGFSLATGAGSPTINLQGYAGANNNTGAITTFIDANNTDQTAPAQVFVGAGTIKGASGNCATPPP